MPASDLIDAAARRYDEYDMASLPVALRRNSLHYHYLSLYPSLAEMRPFSEATRPPYPEVVRSAYIHIPFCSGVCDFCSYYLLALSPSHGERISAYLKLVEQELTFHARRTTLDIGYLFVGGGTPSLIPPEALDRLFSFMSGRGYLNPAFLGTVELHPEFFRDEARARRFLAVLGRHGVGRVSVGYQLADEHLLAGSHRRHTASFLDEAMDLLRAERFMVNLDLMYGLADQSLTSWEATLATAIEASPDSIATYSLFVSPGTAIYRQVTGGRIQLPDHRHLQTQHLMAQVALERAGYHELPNDFYARNVADPERFRQEQLPSHTSMLPVGPGAYGHYSQTQLANVFDLTAYEQRIAAGQSPLWRGHTLQPAEALRRDIMFSFKNDPFLDVDLFRQQYGIDPAAAFPATFGLLIDLNLVVRTHNRVTLTPKGRLVVEEIAHLLRVPELSANSRHGNGDRSLLEKHNFATTYPSLMLEQIAGPHAAHSTPAGRGDTVEVNYGR